MLYQVCIFLIAKITQVYYVVQLSVQFGGDSGTNDAPGCSGINHELESLRLVCHLCPFWDQSGLAMVIQAPVASRLD